MIIYTMDDMEVLREVARDLDELVKFSEHQDAMYRRAVIKATKFPLHLPAIHKKTKSSNSWYLLYEAKSKRDRKEESRVSFVCIVDSPIGLHAILPTYPTDELRIIIYPPHFFVRYRDRFGVNLSGKELILKFFRKNYNYTFDIRERKIDSENMVQEVFGSCEEGIALGVVTTNNNILFRTFITSEMLKGEQVDTYLENNEMRKEMHAKE